MKRLLLSAAVKKILVRFVSTRTTSSDSWGTSSREGAGGFCGAEVCCERRGLPSFCAHEETNPLSPSRPHKPAVKTRTLGNRLNSRFSLRPDTVRNRLITTLCPHFQTVASVGKLDLNATVAPIVAVIYWLVSYQILCTQLLRNLCEGAFQGKHITGEERHSAGLLGQCYQIAILLVFYLSRF